jgi:hypothetical protein
VRDVTVLRARAQLLGRERAAGVADAVRRVVGVQAQDTRAARLAVRVRTEGLTRVDVDRAVGDRSVVRTWAMRGTLHMVAAEDLGWLVGLLGPYFARRGAGRRRQLGLDDDLTQRGVRAINSVLGTAGPLPRAELVARIAEHGVELDPRSQAPAHLVAYAALTGVVCRGPDLDTDEPTYVRVADWVGAQPEVPRHEVPQGEALVRLARRYLRGYGPASAEDFAAWCGLPLGLARAGFGGLAGELEELGERRYALAGSDPHEPAGPEVRLLGHFDTYLLGYRGRELAVPTEFDRRIQTGGGFIMPAVLVDGRVVGTWRQTRTKERIVVTVEPFTTIGWRVRPLITGEVADLGHFAGVPAAIG